MVETSSVSVFLLMAAGMTLRRVLWCHGTFGRQEDSSLVAIDYIRRPFPGPTLRTDLRIEKILPTLRASRRRVGVTVF